MVRVLQTGVSNRYMSTVPVINVEKIEGSFFIEKMMLVKVDKTLNETSYKRNRPFFRLTVSPLLFDQNLWITIFDLLCINLWTLVIKFMLLKI